MANPFGFILIISSLLFISIPSPHARKLLLPHDIHAQKKPWIQTVGRLGNEKVAKIHFYLQDVLAGENQTAYTVAQASITDDSPSGFGAVSVIDELLTAEPDSNSERVGRIQGLITFADLNVSALAMNTNFYFTSGEYNGSTISILGRNPLNDPERELAVVGGTGVFRFARGYAITSTHSFDVENGYGVLEYTLYVTYVDDQDSIMHASLG